MNWKKIFLIIIVLFTFLGAGAMLSNVQSREADQLLEAHGMGNSSRYIYIKKNITVSSFLEYLTHNYKHRDIALHLDNKKKKNQVLVWANHQVIPLSTEDGRYFAPDDFKGKLSFAVIGPDLKATKVETQGNTYLVLNKRYYPVIGELKNYHKIEQNKYYLSTGIEQPTAKEKIRNYRIVIDASNKTIEQIAYHYDSKIAIPKFVKYHQIHRFSVFREIFLIILFWIIAMISNALIAIMQWRQVKLTHLRGSLLRNWLLNRGSRLILIEALLGFVAYFFLYHHAFFRRTDHLIELLIISWLLTSIAYVLTWLYLHRKDKRIA